MDDIIDETIDILLQTAQDERKISNITEADIDHCLQLYLRKQKLITKVYRQKPLRREIISTI